MNTVNIIFYTLHLVSPISRTLSLFLLSVAFADSHLWCLLFLGACLYNRENELQRMNGLGKAEPVTCDQSGTWRDSQPPRPLLILASWWGQRPCVKRNQRVVSLLFSPYGHGEEGMWTVRERTLPPSQEKMLRNKAKLCAPWISDCQPPELWEIHFGCLSHSVYDILNGSLKKLR